MSGHVRRALFLGLVVIAGARVAVAQDPVRLPVMVTTVAPLPPGPRIMVGVVRDTSAITIDSAEITIPALQRRMYTRLDGTFRFEDVKPGKYQVRARKIGYLPQIREITVDTAGGTAAFELLRFERAMAPVVTTAARGGLSGIVGDTAYNAVPGAYVSVMGHGLSAVTDSSGRFFIPAKTGSHMVRIKRPGFAERLVSVNIPPDSGRNVTVTLEPAKKIPVREAWNFEDFSARLSWRNRSRTAFYNHEDMVKLGVEWVSEIVKIGVGVAGGMTSGLARDCAVIVNGGPTTANLETLTTDDVEAVEIYPSGTGASGQMPKRPVSKMSGRKGVASSAIGIPLSNTGTAAFQNLGRTDCVTVYVWLR